MVSANYLPERVFVHENGLCESVSVGPGTRIWAFAHVLSGAIIGQNCNICDHAFVEGDVIVGDDVTIKSGVQLWDGVRLGDRVFVGPNATFANDRFPRSRRRPEAYLQTVLEDDVSIGANATILPGVRIARGAMIGAGAVVTRNVPPFAIVVGNPARIVGYDGASDAEALPARPAPPLLSKEAGATLNLSVGGCWLERLPHFTDMRGDLIALEPGRGVPFQPRRVFLVYDVASDHVRGEHAHWRCEQFLVAAHGGLSIVLDDGSNRREVRLDDPTVGLYLPPLVWCVQYRFDAASVLMVSASHAYDPDDYIRDYETFTRAVADRK